MKLSKRQLRKLIEEQSSLNEGFLDYLIPDAAVEAIAVLLEETLSEYLKDNSKEISENAPYGTQTVVEDFINSEYRNLAKCAHDITISYFEEIQGIKK